MLTPYRVLGVPQDASTDEIRGRYLELIRQHPPSRAPERFARISRAYQAIENDRARINTRIFGASRYPDLSDGLDDLIMACEAAPGSPGLQQLIEAEGLAPSKKRVDA
jgi:curved DNA-binding protein CbpA